MVFINSFSDEKGGITRHPGNENWPLELLSTFSFEDVPGGKTKFTVTWTPHNATEDERRDHVSMQIVKASSRAGAARWNNLRPIWRARNSQEPGMQISAKSCHLPVVRRAGRRGGELLRVGLQEFESRSRQPLRAGCAGQESGSVMVVEFDINGQSFYGAQWRPAVQVRRSGVVPGGPANPQEEIDYFWDKLTERARKVLAAGSRTNLACPGRCFRPPCRKC